MDQIRNWKLGPIKLVGQSKIWIRYFVWAYVGKVSNDCVELQANAKRD